MTIAHRPNRYRRHSDRASRATACRTSKGIREEVKVIDPGREASRGRPVEPDPSLPS
jgi:hypothetical protein